MDRGQNGRDDVFGRRDPFSGFGFGPHRSLFSGLLGGRDPFDDPFFTHPFGGRMMGDHDMFVPSPFGPMGGPFGDMRNGGFIEQAPPRGNRRRPVITEVEEDGGENAEHGNQQPNQDPYVQEPDDGIDETEGGQVELHRDLSRANSGGQPQARTFTYQSSSVTFGGINGAYYTTSKSRRTGSDGITVEESKEADTTTKEATHRISRGIHDKVDKSLLCQSCIWLIKIILNSPVHTGLCTEHIFDLSIDNGSKNAKKNFNLGHSLTRKLNSDGKVDTTQTLHNLNEDESSAAYVGPPRSAFSNLESSFCWCTAGDRSSNGRDRRSASGWALPGTEQGRDPRRNGKPKSRVIPIS
ncbi:glycine-rich protein [Zea mays]|nr:glycine-rich protein [Zea mays]